jgi:methyl-accepting chemotaxis protein
VTHDIALSLKEQSAAANDIAARVERIARMVESADALCDTTHREAQTLESTAQELRRALGHFKC